MPSGAPAHRLAGKVLASAGGAVLDALLPQTCLACGAALPGAAGPVCPGCAAQVTAVAARPGCPRCGRTLPAESIHGHGCARCRTEDFWNVAGVARIGLYVPALRGLLLGLKYAGRERNADWLAERMADAMRAAGWAAALDALVPVPMHWLRRLQRPGNHAALLTEALARRLHLPVVRLVRRARHSRSQVGLPTKAQRFENVRGCFGPPPRWWRWTPAGRRAGDVAGRTLCIVDNLLVTGATVHEVAKVLRKAGARRIYAAVAVRTPAPGDPPAGPPVPAEGFPPP